MWKTQPRTKPFCIILWEIIGSKAFCCKCEMYTICGVFNLFSGVFGLLFMLKMCSHYMIFPQTGLSQSPFSRCYVRLDVPTVISFCWSAHPRQEQRENPTQSMPTAMQHWGSTAVIFRNYRMTADCFSTSVVLIDIRFIFQRHIYISAHLYCLLLLH